MTKEKKRPLGKVLHIFNSQAICKPDRAFKGRGWNVFIDEKRIGKLGDPFGGIDHPYQPVILVKNIQEEEIVGKEVYAIPKSRNRNKKKYYKKKKN